MQNIYFEEYHNSFFNTIILSKLQENRNSMKYFHWVPSDFSFEWIQALENKNASGIILFSIFFFFFFLVGFVFTELTFLKQPDTFSINSVIKRESC